MMMVLTCIAEKGLVALFYAFEKNYGMSLSLDTLKLSGNSFGRAGSAALESWINNVKSYGKLKRLILANADFNVVLTPSMKLLARTLHDLQTINNL